MLQATALLAAVSWQDGPGYLLACVALALLGVAVVYLARFWFDIPGGAP